MPRTPRRIPSVKLAAVAAIAGLAGLGACREEPIVEIDTPEGEMRIEQDGEININD